MKCEYDLTKQVFPKVIINKTNSEYNFVEGLEVDVSSGTSYDLNGEWFCDFGVLDEYFDFCLNDRLYKSSDFEAVYFCYDYMQGDILLKSNIKNSGYTGLILKGDNNE